MVRDLAADKWIELVGKAIGTGESIIHGHDPKLVCGMKPRKVPKKKLDDVVNIAISEAEGVARAAFQ